MRHRITTFGTQIILWLSTLLCAAGCSKSGVHYNLTSAPDYSSGTMWFDVQTDTLAEVDVFYIAPTCIWDWQDGDGRTYHHMDTDNPKQRSRVDGSLHLAHALFGKYCRFYAPYYRQVTMQSGWFLPTKRSADTRSPTRT